MIKDADSDDENNSEQSDIVMILLNLSAIPDEVAQKFDFAMGFQPEFLRMMNAYKRRFERRYGIKYEYSTDLNIERYKTFKRTRQRLVENLHYRPQGSSKAREKQGAGMADHDHLRHALDDSHYRSPRSNRSTAEWRSIERQGPDLEMSGNLGKGRRNMQLH